MNAIVGYIDRLLLLYLQHLEQLHKPLTMKSMNLVNLTKYILHNLNKEKKIVKFKYKKLKKENLINFCSIYKKKFFSSKDKYFSDEIIKTISYVKKNFK